MPAHSLCGLRSLRIVCVVFFVIVFEKGNLLENRFINVGPQCLLRGLVNRSGHGRRAALRVIFYRKEFEVTA